MKCEVCNEEKEATEISGSEAIAMIHKETVEMAEYWKNKYLEGEKK